MESDQAEQLDALINKSAKVLNKNCETEETDVSTTSKRDNMSLSPFGNKDTQREIVMAQKRDTSSSTSINY